MPFISTSPFLKSGPKQRILKDHQKKSNPFWSAEKVTKSLITLEVGIATLKCSSATFQILHNLEALVLSITKRLQILHNFLSGTIFFITRKHKRAFMKLLYYGALPLLVPLMIRTHVGRLGLLWKAKILPKLVLPNVHESKIPFRITLNQRLPANL
jgi:hypothetical protein